MLNTDLLLGGGIIRREARTYAAPDSGPWPDIIGDNLQQRMNAAQLETQSPLAERVLTQNNTSYTWQAQAFNAYAQVT
ncbi:MAG TPA: hypothetical protein VFG73_07300, partial [Rhodanobacteraceae bacterium]|nr:hypothetical protein [Rhodanobacteraceae bacterium]